LGNYRPIIVLFFVVLLVVRDRIVPIIVHLVGTSTLELRAGFGGLWERITHCFAGEVLATSIWPALGFGAWAFGGVGKGCCVWVVGQSMN
jgi:hypothetical protein